MRLVVDSYLLSRYFVIENWNIMSDASILHIRVLVYFLFLFYVWETLQTNVH